jgi:FkbM family methyltransferase
MINWFDYYHAAVEPESAGGDDLVDYSQCTRHRVRGFDLFPVMFNALAEPVVTTQQYLQLAPVPAGGVVIDLGGYSGLSSMIFALAAGERGRVICVEADPDNQRTIRANLATFRRVAPAAAPIAVEEKAVWKHDEGVAFSSEGNMGATVAELMRRGTIVSVPSITLSGLAGKYGLERIDVIKCDIEGAEACIFERESQLLRKYQPTILVEVHAVNGKFSSDYFMGHLEQAGYEMTTVAQDGASVPLVVARPGMA